MRNVVGTEPSEEKNAPQMPLYVWKCNELTCEDRFEFEFDYD